MEIKQGVIEPDMTVSTAIVTGGSMGFGRALATELAGQNWNLVIDGRSRFALDEAARMLEAIGPGQVRAIAGDVADEGHRFELVESAIELNDFRVLVNNASTLGPIPQPRLSEYPVDALKTVIEVNLLAPLALTQLAIPHLRASGGTLVNMTSDAAVEAYEGWGGYGSSKAALEQMSNILAVEEPDISVYWFDPGDMRTQMHQDAFSGEDISDRPLPESRVPALIDLLTSGLPSGRYTAESFLSPSASN